MTRPTSSAGPAPRGPGRRHNAAVQTPAQVPAERPEPTSTATSTPTSAPTPTTPSAPPDSPTGPAGAHLPAGPLGRAGRLVAVLALPALCVLLLPLAAWLDVQAPDSGTGPVLAGGEGWPWAVNGALLGVLAAIVLLHDRRQLFGWTLAGFGLFWGLDGLAQSYINAGLTSTDAWPAMTLALWFLNRVGAYLTVVSAILVMVFPTGRFLDGAWGRWSRAVVALMLAAGTVFLVLPSAGRTPDVTVPASVDLDPTSVDALAPVTDALAGAAVATLFGTLTFALVTVVVRYRRARGTERDRMRWFAWSAVVAMAVPLLTAVVELPFGSYVTLLVLTVLPPAAMTVAIVRPALVPIQDLLGRTLVLLSVLAVLLAADAAVLALLALVLDDTLTQGQVVAVVLLVAVLLYGPLRTRLSAAVRRRMLGERAHRYDVVAGLASALENTESAGDQLAAVAGAVASAFGVSFVSVEVATGQGQRLVTTLGERPARVRTLPVTYRGAAVGSLVLPATGLRSHLTQRDQELLGDLVRQAAAAARASQLAEEVQQARQRLVSAREEERRRIRRDLHDGLGPALSGMVFGLEAARLQLGTDPEAAAERLEVIAEQAQSVVGDVRRLVHDLRPPALDDRGLLGALRQQADGLGLELEVTDRSSGAAPDAGERLPAAVEVAAYRIASEALTNVARHAGTVRVALRLDRSGHELVLEVRDDGRGIAADRVPGVGLLAQRERAAELGGEVTVESTPGGGTTVRARLPLAGDTTPPTPQAPQTQPVPPGRAERAPTTEDPR